MLKYSILIFLFFSTLIVAGQKDSSTITFYNANLIDGISTKPKFGVAVTIKNGKIERIDKRNNKIKEGIRIDLAGKWIMPGFIDAHVHFPSFEAANMALATGVTTARTMQCDKFIDIAIRDAHKLGRFDLPDIIAAGYQIRPDLSEAFFSDFPELHFLKPRLHGVENVRLAVRALISRGVNHIKVLATERAGTPNTDPTNRTFSYDELEAIVKEAKKAGLRVAAHAHTSEAAVDAIRAGVISIEHGTYLDDHVLNMMKAHGVYFSPTFSFWSEAAMKPVYKQNKILAERVLRIPQKMKEVTTRAYKKGISILAATDITYTVADINLYNEAIILQEAGMTNMDIIKGMTSKAAKCLNISRKTGVINEGMEADIVILNSNPLQNLDSLKDIYMVINNGRIFFKSSE